MSIFGNPVVIGGGGSSPVIQALSATVNGTYTAPSGVDGYSPVTVNVEGGSTLVTKTITENGTYDATDDNADGYSSVTVNVSSGAPIVYYDYAVFDGSGYFILPFKENADYTITTEFDTSTNTDIMSVIGSDYGVYGTFIGRFNSKWYVNNGINNGAFSELIISDTSLGHHTCIINKDNGVYWDGNYEGVYYPTTQDCYLWIGNRAIDGQKYVGKFYQFKIESISTGDTLCYLRPATVGGVPGLYDTVNQVLYINGITEVQ